MENKIKHLESFNKKETKTKLKQKEYAIITKENKVYGTQNYEIVLKALQDRLTVYEVKTYEITLKTKLKNE